MVLSSFPHARAEDSEHFDLVRNGRERASPHYHSNLGADVLSRVRDSPDRRLRFGSLVTGPEFGTHSRGPEEFAE
jgi:hypothetical protein